MKSQELQLITTAWINFQHSWDVDPASQKTKSFEWSYEAALELLTESPEDAWQLILRIHGEDSSEVIRQILSAGFFEDFMELHGPEYIDRVEAEVARQPTFAGVVAGIWKGPIADDVWSRIETIKLKWR